MKRIAVFYNPTSGNQDKDIVIQQMKSFFLRNGFTEENLLFVQPKSPQEAFDLAKKATLEKVDMVIPLGGDGTINKICGGVYEGGGHSVIGIIPTGTINNFAKALGIPLQLEAALENLLSGETTEFDLAKVNDTYMISSLTLGILADIAAGVTSQAKRKLGPLAYVKDAYKVIRHNKSYRIQVLHQGYTKMLKTKLLLITLTSTIAGFQVPAPDVSYNDGLIRVFSLKEIHLWKLLWHLKKIRKGQFEDFTEMYHFDTNELTIYSLSSSKRTIPFSRIDGDKSDALPLQITVFKKALKTKIPK
ncbi:diacylglycerol kinase family lipid kinase [Streptococcus sp. X16XC17]|uniref:diacylglycerol/lipid kinase family protein n=1 Tax=unclassified Streptococcus TaxID=2608887 RepID=UPI00066FB8A3|nr:MULTISPECIES: diacylglycerol kinase family protein [unclassified Streptococcus]TCD46210.1 diacylglycerol kinase family lipid kinase [Streptococcus sp. X16XC17]